MTGRMKEALALLAALLLAGCSSGHVGEDWQCPLAVGGSCASIAAADPAVPKTDTAEARTTGQPLRLLPLEWDREKSTTSPMQEPGEMEPCEASCDPFAWLARLFGGETVRSRAEPVEAARTDSRIEVAPPPVQSTPDHALPAGSPSGSASGDDEARTLRSDEVVARIWIAPFVDADGVYREASHVRVVLEPADWRLR